MFLLELNSLINITNSIFFLVNEIDDFSNSFLILNKLELLLFIKLERRKLLNIILFIKTRIVFTLFNISDLTISI